MNRGRGRQCVFQNRSYYEAFLLCLEEANKRFGIEIHAYCLLGKHYHLLIKRGVRYIVQGVEPELIEGDWLPERLLILKLPLT
jgi:hypothetical protein